jgi:hypothetical protein
MSHMAEHSPDCIDAQNSRFNEISSWVKRYPDYCRMCKGFGQHECDAYSLPCKDCVEKGLCARCGKPGLTCENRGDESTGEGPCSFCGWDYKDGRPEPIECFGDCVGANL